MRHVSELMPVELSEHEYWMARVLDLARQAADLGEVPIGAVLVRDGQLISQAYNLRELNHSATAHAEVLAIQAANQVLSAWRLSGTTLYVNLEPCAMCAGAIINSRVDRVVYAASDPKAGCAGSLMNLLGDERFNHQPEVVVGVLAEASQALLKDFFRQLRQRNKARKQAQKAAQSTDLSTE